MMNPETKLKSSMETSNNKLNIKLLFSELFKDRIFFKRMIGIALPVAFQNLLNMVVNMVDTLMIGELGTSAVAAVGLGNKVYFVFALLVFGISSGIGLLSAQYWGSKDIEHKKGAGAGNFNRHQCLFDIYLIGIFHTRSFNEDIYGFS